MQTSCVRSGQVEFGTVSHQGREFTAIGASVVGRNLTAYTRCTHGEIHLTSWCGKTILSCRSEVVQRYCDESLAMIFRLSTGDQIITSATARKQFSTAGNIILIFVVTAGTSWFLDRFIPIRKSCIRNWNRGRWNYCSSVLSTIRYGCIANDLNRVQRRR